MTTDNKEPQSSVDRMILFRMTSLEDALRALTQQVGRLVLIEERQSQTSASVERAFAEIKALDARMVADNKASDARIKALELAQPITNRTNVWVERAVIAIVGAAMAGAFLWR